MSPDPPREDSGEDENRLRRFSGEFMEGMMNDDEFFIIAPDAPYEMDVEEESEYSDSSDDDGANGGREASTSQMSSSSHEASSIPRQRVELLQGSDGDVLLEGQSRGRYRLLIPFPASTIIEDNPESGTSSNAQSISSDNQAHSSGSSSSNNAPQVEVLESSSDHSQRAIKNQASDDATCDQTSSASESDSSKREIDLTEEKVEKIKEVMKNITLPPASIPNWVSEVNEDAWKKKLSDSIKVSKPDKR